MEIVKLIELSLDDLEVELDTGSYSVEELSEALELEKAGKSRKGAVELYEDAIILAGEPEPEPDPEPESEKYVVADGKAMHFKAGAKCAGDEVDLNWPEYQKNEGLLAEHIARKLVVKI